MEVELSAAQEAQWREAGFCTTFLLPPEVCQKARAACYAAAAQPSGPNPFGSSGQFEFPSATEPLNELFLHERIVAAARRLLRTSDVRLTQADAWIKRGEAEEARQKRPFFASVEQRMHMDFPNHDSLHPPPFDRPNTLAVIVYLDDSSECAGETGVVPRSGAEDAAYQRPYLDMPGVGARPWVNDREQAEDSLDPATRERRAALYAREELVRFKVGTVLLYRHDLWHRGRPIASGKTRLVVNMVLRAGSATHITSWGPGVMRFAYNIKRILTGLADQAEVGHVERMMVALSPAQRGVLGFPLPGAAIWEEADTLEMAKRRWEPLGMDFGPYEAELRAPRRLDRVRDRVRALEDELSKLRDLEAKLAAAL